MSDVQQGEAAPGRPTMDPLTTSAAIDQLATALAKAQGALQGAKKDSVNPHFKSNYADLASVWEACRKALSDNAIAVVQIPNGDGVTVRMTTLLAHTSGQWIGGTSSMTAQQATPQGIGSCQTYLRRYSLMAMIGIAPEDDDGNDASSRAPNGNGQQQGPRPVQNAPRPAPASKLAAPAAQRSKDAATDAQINDVLEIAGELGWTSIDIEKFMHTAIGYACGSNELSTGDAKKLLEAMVAEQNRKAAS